MQPEQLRNAPRGIRKPGLSLRQAINAKCRECLYDPGCGGGHWRQQITDCTDPKCSLYPVRPTTKSKGDDHAPDA